MPRTTTALGTSLGGLLKGVQAGRQGAAAGDHQAVQDAYMMAQMENLRSGGANKSAEVAAKTARSNEQQDFNADDERQYGSALELNGLSSALAKGVADYYKNPTPGKFKTSVDMPEITGLPAAAPITASYEQEAPGGLTPAQLSGVQRTKGVLGAQYRLSGDTNAQQLTKSMMDLLGRQDAEGIYADPSLAQGVNTAAAAAAGKLYDNGRDPGTVLSQGTGQLAIGNQPVYDAGIAKTRSETSENIAQAEKARKDAENGGPGGSDEMKAVLKLRNDFTKETSAFREIRQARDNVKNSLGQNTAGGDLSAATAIMKMLDPGSVVRESELGMAMNATGAIDRMGNYAQLLANGQRLNPTQRKEMLSLAASIFDTADNYYQQQKQTYRDMSQRYNLPVEFVVGKSTDESKQPTQAASGKVRNITAASDWLKRKNIKDQGQFAAAVQELIAMGWSRDEIQRAQLKAGL